MTPPALGAGLEGKGVLVTGALGGIGIAVARAFADCGARVAVSDLAEDGVRELAAHLPGEGHAGVAANLADTESHAGLVRRAEEAVGPLVALAHLAAVLRRTHDIAAIAEADWDAQVDVNFKGTFFLDRAFAEHLRAAGRPGAIVNFSSQGWWTGGFGGSVVYSATKGGIVSMCRGLARTYAKDGITVNSVSPGAVDTTMMRGGLTDAQLQASIDMIPLGYMAEPADLAGTVVFLASDQARYITGATINVSGGWLMY